MNKYGALFCVVTLAGCSSNPVLTTNNLGEQWGAKLRAYQYLPVFPPREDIQVGDIYVLCSKSARAQSSSSTGKEDANANDLAKQAPPISTWLARVSEMRTSVEDTYKSSVVLPAAKVSSSGSTPDPTKDLTELPSDSGFLSGQGDTKRLRNVSLPEFFSANISNVEAGGLIPAGVILAGLGFSSEDVGTVSVTVPSAGSYGLPAWAANSALEKSSIWQNSEFWRWANAYAGSYEKYCASGSGAKFVLVTEVLAAYALDVNLAFTKASAGKLQTAMVVPADSTRQKTLDTLLKHFSSDAKGGDSKGDTGISNSQSGNTQANSQANAVQPLNEELLAQLRTLLASASGREQQQFPGISAQIVTGSSSGIRVNRKFANPVVIGFRGLSLTPGAGEDKPTNIDYAELQDGLFATHLKIKIPGVETQPDLSAPGDNKM